MTMAVFICAAVVIPAYCSEARDSVLGVAEKRKGFFGRLIDYFGKANKPRDDGKIDISFLGGPHFSSDDGFGIGLVATGVYGHPMLDSITGFQKQSQTSLYSDFTTKGRALVGMQGIHLMRNDAQRLIYDVYFQFRPWRFWGIGYEAAREKDGYSKYSRLSVQLKGIWDFRIANGFYIGPMFDLGWTGARKITDKSKWEGMPTAIASIGIGVTFSYDTRDNTTAPKHGVYATIGQSFYPRFLGNGRGAFSMTRGTVSYYNPLWRDATLASRFNITYSYGDTPWTMMPSLGGPYVMRGYYQGQYCDKGEMDLSVELRQRVWRRSGIAGWGGAGAVFPNFYSLRWRKVLPNFGIGYRWEFKKNSNVRLDLGFGKGQYGFIFNINEAF